MFLWNAIARTKNLIFILSKNRTVWLFGWADGTPFVETVSHILLSNNHDHSKCSLNNVLLTKYSIPFVKRLKSNNSSHLFKDNKSFTYNIRLPMLYSICDSMNDSVDILSLVIPIFLRSGHPIIDFHPLFALKTQCLRINFGSKWFF